MAPYSFPSMPLAEWKDTRDTIQMYSQLLGAIRMALTPRQKHWWHISLRVDVDGLTTTPIPAGENAPAHTFSMTLNLLKHNLVIRDSRGEVRETALTGHSGESFCKDVLGSLNGIGIAPEIDRAPFAYSERNEYDPGAAERFWQVISQINQIFTGFRNSLHHETSPIQLWPHHFDLAFQWFSGQLIPGEDPTDAEKSAEQMNFGFATGDDAIADPYFYITVHPLNEKMAHVKLPDDVRWHKNGWQGAVLMYEALTRSQEPKEKLETCLGTVFTSVSAFLMEF